jgi:ABC-type transport system substrate-binding protein
MAAVYLAFDSRLDREVALKLLDQRLSSDPSFTARFEREAKTVASLEHSAIVPLYDFGEADGWLHLVMRYMKGGSLKELIAKGALSPKTAAYVVRRIGGALDKAHSEDVVHRDLKPANILLDEYQKPYLSDFGIVKVAKGDTEYLTETGQTLGTYAYMSPEQLLGKEVTGRSDIYALGIVLYEMITGEHPYAESATTSAAMAIAHAQTPTPEARKLVPTLPPVFDEVIQKAMAKDPAERYAAGAEMAAALRAFLGDQSPAATTGAAAAVAATAKPDPAPQATPEKQPAPTPQLEAPKSATRQPASPIPAQQPAKQPPASQPAEDGKRKIPVWIFAVAGVAVIACICSLLVIVPALGDLVSSPTATPVEEVVEAVEEVATEEPVEAPTEEPIRAPTDEPTEEPVGDSLDPAALFPDFQPLSFGASSCDYGGIIKSISAVDALTVRFDLCQPDPAFLAKMAFAPFGIQSSEWLEKTGGSGELLRQPIGTGPYKLEDWIQGDQMVFKRFDEYWGPHAAAETAVLRWNAEGAARLLELQTGAVDYITNVSPDDIAAVSKDPNLTLLPVETPNILYLGMSNTFKPFNDRLVRLAIANGIDRRRIVENFYPEGSEVASHFTPCTIPNGCQGDSWYEFDPELGRQLLAEAGFPDGFETTIYYRDVFRTYLPEPSLVAVELQSQLQENLGITAEVVVLESGEFVSESTQGNLDGLYMLGWGADYPHVTNFLDFHFGAFNPQYGDPHPEIYEVLAEAAQIADPDEAAPLYALANNAIRDLVPMVPIAHSVANNAALSSVSNAYAPPFGATQFYKMDPGDDTLVFMQNAEPISVYCQDETDGESLRACQQVVESLLEYDDSSGKLVPELATSCDSNDDGTIWTCDLRQGVLFHDGSMLDANDVVFSWSVGIDAASPLHVGNTGTYDYFNYLFNGLINAP